MNKEIEKQFQNAVKLAQEEMKNHFDNLQKELDAIISISEKYGVPFCSEISPLTVDWSANKYMPHSFQEKWEEIYDLNLTYNENQNLFGHYVSDYESGWQYSNIYN